MKTNTKKIALAGVLCAVAVVGSMFSFPVFGSKCAPVQHMVNVLCAVLLGPWYGVAVAFVASLLRNLLGLGNAATPAGLRAARRMGGGERAGNALCLFLVLNASAAQLLPTTVLSLRAAAGSAAPGAVIGPGLIASGIAAAVGVISCKLWEKRP